MSYKKTQKSTSSSNGSLAIIVLRAGNSQMVQKLDEKAKGMNVSERIMVLSSAEDLELNTVIAADPRHIEEKVESDEYDHLLFIDAKQFDHLPKFLTSYRQGKKNISDDKFYAFDSKANSKKRDFRRGFFNWWTQFLTPIENKGNETGAIVIPAAKALKSRLLAYSESEKHLNVYRLSALASLCGIKGDTIPLVNAEQVEFKPPLSTPFLEMVILRIQWFVVRPLKGPKNWSNGNSAIYRLIFATLCFFSFVILPMLSFDYGITWDEPEDRKYFQEVIAYFQTGGDDQRCLDTDRKLHNHLVNYGPFVNLLMATVNEYISPFDIYETRHIVNTLFLVIGLIFTGLIARRLKNWRTAVFGFLILLLTPTIFGHGFNNQKDIPFLAFYIASIYYIIRFVEDLPKVRVKSFTMLAICMGILMSIRVGGLLVFAYLIMFAGIKFLMQLKENKGRQGKLLISYLIPGLSVIAIAYGLGVVFWPAALQDPLNHPLSALQNFEKFSFVHIFEIFEGTRYYMKEFPWYYGPKLILLTVPLFFLAGITLLVVLAKKAWTSYPKHTMGILLFTAIFPLAYIIYKESALYNGWRHLLFIYPSLVILAAAGWELVIGSKWNKGIRIAATVVLFGLIGKTTAWMVQNHPYQYVYYNEIAGGVSGAYGEYETDYWCQSPREAMKWLMENENLNTGEHVIVSNNEIISLQYYADKYQEDGSEIRELKRQKLEIQDEIDQLNFFFKDKQISKEDLEAEREMLTAEEKAISEEIQKRQNIKVIWSRDQQWNKDDWDYAIWTTRTLSKTQLTNGYFPPKGTIHTIEVDGVPLAAIVKRETSAFARANKAIRAKKLDSALVYLNEYIAYDPLEEEAYTTKAEILFQMMRYDEAIEAANKAIEIRPENYVAYYITGRALIYQQKLDEAEIALRQAIEYKDNLSGGYQLLGDIYLRRGNAVKAKEFYETSIEYNGGNYQLYYNMGLALMNLGDRNNAAAYFNASVQTKPDFKEGYYQLYQIFKAAGNQQEAQKYLQRFQQLGGRAQ